MVNYSHNLDLVFHALSDPTRRSILRLVAKKEKRIKELSDPFDMSLAAISKHLKVLERAGLVNRRKSGREFYMSMNQEALISADQWISFYKKFWVQQLDSLEKHLKTKK